MLILNKLLIKVASSSLVLIAFIVGLLVFNRVMLYVFKKLLLKNISNENRALTIYAIIHDLFNYIMWMIMIIGVLYILGVDVAVLIASFGVISIILGLAAQQVIMDMVNGFFTIVEGYYDVGDYIKVGDHEGYVVSFGIKVTVLQTFSNQMITIPNSKIVDIINYSKDNYAQIIKIGVSYDTDMTSLENLIKNIIITKVLEDSKVLTCDYLGVDELADSSVNHAFKLTSLEENRFYVKRVLFRNIKIIFDQEGIEIPFNQLVISSKDNF